MKIELMQKRSEIRRSYTQSAPGWWGENDREKCEHRDSSRQQPTHYNLGEQASTPQKPIKDNCYWKRHPDTSPNEASEWTNGAS